MRRDPARRRVATARRTRLPSASTFVFALITISVSIMMLLVTPPPSALGSPFMRRNLAARSFGSSRHGLRSAYSTPAWISSSSTTTTKGRRIRSFYSPASFGSPNTYPCTAAAAAAAADTTTIHARTRQKNLPSWTKLHATLSPPSFSSTTNETNIHSLEDDEDQTIVLLDDMDGDWRTLPALNPTIHFASWIVPTGNALQRILHAKEMQPHLATRLDLLQHLQGRRRFKVIQNLDPSHILHKTHKLVLLLPDTPPALEDMSSDVQSVLAEFKDDDDDIITDGPTVPISFSYMDFCAHYALEQVLPRHAHPVPSAFETIGHVAHLNLRSIHLPYKHVIGQVLLQLVPNIDVVMAKQGQVQGPFRTYDFEILAPLASTSNKDSSSNDDNDEKGDHNDVDENYDSSMTMVQVTEWGITCRFNVRQVYWSSRLSTERRRLCLQELFADNKNGDELFIADAFCGVGALCLQAMKHYSNHDNNSNNDSSGSTTDDDDHAEDREERKKKKNIVVWANDWNPAATQALADNAKRNGIATKGSSVDQQQQQQLVIRCGDAYEFLMDLGIQATKASVEDENEGDTSPTNDGEQPLTPRRLPDHVVMNYPLEAPTFLGALRWWPVAAAATTSVNCDDDGAAVVIPRVHVYTFARADPDTHRTAEQVALDLIAQNLIPGMSVPRRPDNDSGASTSKVDASQYHDDDYDDVPFKSTEDELNDEYNANVCIHAVRDVAPGKVVYCVSFSVTPRLLRHMQGDFV